MFSSSLTIVDKLIDAASSTFGVRLELPNAEQMMPSGLRCLVRFELDHTKKVTARIDSDQTQ
jgi:hypothetical protein